MGILSQARNGDERFLEIEISCREGSASTQSALIFFLSSFGGQGRIFFSFVPNMFHSNSHQVPTIFTRFSMCSSRVFPIAPRFNPICFAQSPPLLTYIGGPKDKGLHFSIESSILGSLHSFNTFFFSFFSAMGQSTCSWSFCHPIMLLDHGVSKIWVPLA